MNHAAVVQCVVCHSVFIACDIYFFVVQILEKRFVDVIEKRLVDISAKLEKLKNQVYYLPGSIGNLTKHIAKLVDKVDHLSKSNSNSNSKSEDESD